jgi:hypothetical protein
MMRPRLIRPSYFFWLVAPVVLVGIYHAYGLPHAIWNYEYSGSRTDWSQRTYHRCTFVGPYGSFTTYPADGRCPWFAFFKRKEAPQ